MYDSCVRSRNAFPESEITSIVSMPTSNQDEGLLKTILVLNLETLFASLRSLVLLACQHPIKTTGC